MIKIQLEDEHFLKQLSDQLLISDKIQIIDKEEVKPQL